MGKTTTIRRKDGLTFSFNFSNLDRYKRKVEKLKKGDGLMVVAEKLQSKAVQEMRDVYMRTKGKGKNYRENAGELTRALFNSIPKPTGSDGKYEITIVSSRIFEKYPYIRFQESGARMNVDLQPYRINPQTGRIFPPPLSTIKKSKAKQIKDRIIRVNTPNGPTVRKMVVYLKVPHKIEARGFILAAKKFIKSKGSKFVKNLVEEELRKK